jgi:RNA polymerase sigma-70 factor (ECF subfamily)
VAYFGNRILGRIDEVDDLVQDVFLAAARENLAGDPPAVRQWLKTTAVRNALNRLRWRRLRERLGLSSVAAPDAIDPRADPETKAIVVQLHAVLERVPPAARLAWVLRFQEGEPLEVVAQLCACSLATAKRRIKTAQDRIREAFGEA